jgi:hypothetical protein
VNSLARRQRPSGLPGQILEWPPPKKPLVSPESRPDTWFVGGTCPNCGRGIDGREEFCARCGAFLGWDAAGTAESQLYQQPTQPDDQRAAVQLQISSDLIRVTPGSSESTTVTAKNLGTKVEELRFEVTGPAWIVVKPAVVSVYPGQQASGVVQVAPPRASTSAAGVTPFQITVTSAVHAHVSSSVACRADVTPYLELAAELVPTSSTGRRTTHHHVKLENRGNVPLRVGLHPTDVADGLRVGMPAFGDLDAGTVREVPVSVQASFRWIGRPEPKTFSVIAEGPKPLAPSRMPGTRIVIPLLPRWVPAIAVGLAAAAVAAAVLVPKLHAHNSALHSHGLTTASGAASAPASPSAGASSTPTSSPTASASPSVASTPAYDLVAQSQNATWVSYSPLGTEATTVRTGSGCFARANFTTLSQGAVFDVSQVQLSDGTVASTAVETDPPSRASARIVGTYTLTSPTTAGEVFRAYIGFCYGTSGPNVQYQVTFGSTAQYTLPYPTIPTTGQLGSIDLPVPAGTTQVQLSVTDVSDSGADIVWVDAEVEPSSVPPPTPP